MLEDAYANFRHEAVAPLVQIGPNHFLLELFHGPTLAFKDVAMQFLARLMDHVLAERGERATIVGATSGDTGGAAIEAFRGRERVDIAILFPDGRVSPVQRRQMTTAREKNVQAIAIEGTFDDAQALVKAMFNDLRFRERVRLSGVNSINWGRMSRRSSIISPRRWRSARHIGRCRSPCQRAISATSSRAMRPGAWGCRSKTWSSQPTPTTSCTGRFRAGATNCAVSVPPPPRQWISRSRRTSSGCCSRPRIATPSAVRRLMAGLGQSGAFTLRQGALESLSPLFASGASDEAMTAATMKAVRDGTDYILDPHTAVAVGVAEKHLGAAPMVTLGTAHPAKFPDAVEAAIGRRPELPDWAKHILTGEERYLVLPNELSVIQDAVEAHTRAAAAVG
jgi:threonine synthase